MKKYCIFAAAALVALAACSKIETAPEATPDVAISFQVANYARQTKATSLVTEGFTSFKTYAWFTSKNADGSLNANQVFMAPATVAYNGTDTWKPTDRTYYWPKTGYVNFFSFAGKHLPDEVVLNATSKAGEAHYTTTMTIATDDNILVADEAYGFNSNPNATYHLDGVTKGVPTLFRHMLSKVVFDITVDARTDAEGVAITDDKNNWEVVVNSATVSYRNKGTLEVAFPTTPAVALGTDNKPTAAGSTQKYNSAVWTPADVDNVTLSKVSDAVSVNANGGTKADPVTMIAESVVMPQTLATTAVTIALEYTLTHKYNNANPNSEYVPIAATALTTFTPTISAWAPNTIYKYHIIVKPNGSVLFDPAVEVWADPVTEASKEI